MDDIVSRNFKSLNSVAEHPIHVDYVPASRYATDGDVIPCNDICVVPVITRHGHSLSLERLDMRFLKQDFIDNEDVIQRSRQLEVMAGLFPHTYGRVCV